MSQVAEIVPIVDNSLAGAHAPVGSRKVSRIVIVGLGYVGLPSAVCLARTGYQVTGADISERVVSAIREGRSPLRGCVSDQQVRELVQASRLEATVDTTKAVSEADFVVVCVPTPVDEHRRPDLRPLQRASESIGRGLQRGTVVSYESTTFPGCTERECIPILERESGLKAGHDFGVVYCPERINPGDSAHGSEATPRVLGALDERSLLVAKGVYSSFLRAPLYLCKDIRTAECAKVLENVQRDVNIAVVNEFAMICPRIGLDAHEVLVAAGSKFNFVPVQPGPGVGGHCIPVDPYYFIMEARRAGIEPRVMATARLVNDEVTDHVARVILEHVSPRSGESRVALLGLSYKGGVGDVRESPAVRLAEILRGKRCKVRAHDPYVETEDVFRAAGLPTFTLDSAVRGAHVIALLTDHPEFRALDWRSLAGLAAPGAMVVDTRNLVDRNEVRAAGLRYWGLGRGSA